MLKTTAPGMMLGFGMLAIFAPGTYAATPSAQNSLPATAFAGETVCFNSSFTNTGSTGYGPYFRLFSAPGLSVASVTAFSQTLSVNTVGQFSAGNSNSLNDPTIGQAVSGIEGETFSVVSLPIGSVVENGPQLTAEICVAVDSSAQLGSELSFALQPVFEFGDTATGNNGPEIGALVSASLTPSVLAYTYTQQGKEEELVPGAGFPITFRHSIDIADGQTLTNLNLSDQLDAQLVYDGGLSVSNNACSADSEPVIGSAGGSLTLACSSITGGATQNDVTVTYSSYVDDILDETSCAVSSVTNEGQVSAAYNGQAIDPVTKNTGFTAKHVAVQQALSANEVIPGDTITITDSLQTSAYATTTSLTVTDVLPDGLIFSAMGSISGSPAGTVSPQIVNNSDGSQTLTFDVVNGGSAIPADSTITITYSATVQSQYNSGEPVVASDELDTSSGATYSLSAGASACNDNSAASTRIRAVAASKVIKNAQTEYTPGDQLTFILSLEVPSGDTNSITFTDYLPLPVFKAADINTGFGNDIRLASADTAGLTPTSITTNAGTNAVVVSFPDASFNEARVIAVELDVVVDDDPFGDGLALTNLLVSETLNSANEIDEQLENVALTVRAPDLSVELNNDAVGDVDAGDVIGYTLEITNEGGASAFDISAQAPVAEGLNNATNIVVTIDGSATTNYTGSLTDGTFKINDPLPAGKVLVISYDRVVASDVIPRQQITTENTTVWASNTGASSFPAQSADTSFTVGSAKISMQVIDVTPEGSPGNVVVGDTVTYQADITLPEGQVENLATDFVLPEGFEYVANSVTVNQTGYTGTVTSDPSVTTSGAVDTGQGVNLAFDTVTTTDNNNVGDNTFTVQFEALVTTNNVNSAKNAKQAKQIDADVNFDNFTGAAVKASTSNDFAEHNIKINTTVTPATDLAAGDFVTVNFRVRNQGTAPAYDLVVSNVVDGTLFDLTTVTADSVPAGYSYNYTNPTVTFSTDGDALAAGGELNFSYTATVKDDVQSGSAFSVQGQAVADSQAGNVAVEREQTQTNQKQPVTANPVAQSIALIASSESFTSDADTADVAIGEVQTYELTVAIPQGTTQQGPDNNLISVELPAGYQYLSDTATIRENSDTTLSSSVVAGLNSTDTAITPDYDGSTLSFDLGTVTNSDSDANTEQLVVTFDVIALNTDDNERSDSKTVTGKVNYQNAANTVQSNSTAVQSTIVTPALSVALTANPASVAGGDTVTYTLVATNQDEVDTTRGWEWLISETLPADIAFNSLVSAQLSSGVDLANCFSVSGQELTLDSTCVPAAERYLAPGDSIALVYTADVDTAIGFEQEVVSTASFSVTSLPGEQGTANATPGSAGSDTGERLGDNSVNTGGQAVNQLRATDTATIQAGAPVVNLIASATDVTIADTFTYDVSFDIPTGSTESFVYTLDLPTGISYTGEEMIITTPVSGFTSSNTPATTQAAGTDPVVLDFGTIANTAGSSQVLQISIPVQVDNVQTNQDGAVLDASASLSYQGASEPAPSDITSVTVNEADLALTQTVIQGASGSDAGDTIRYRTVLSNTGAQASAQQVLLTDIMPAELLGAPDGTGSGNAFDNITVQTTGAVTLNGTATAVSETDIIQTTTTNDGDTLTLPALTIAAGASLTLEYDVIVSNSAQAGDTLTNTVEVVYNSQADGSGRNGTDGGDDNNNALLNNYQVTDTSAVVVNNALAVQSQLNPAHSENALTIGETVSIDQRIDVVEGEVSAVNLTVDLPEGMRFVSSSASAPGQITYTGSDTGSVNGGNQVEISLGDITNATDSDSTNDFVTVTVLAVIEDNTDIAAGDTLQTSASVSGGGATAGPSLLDINVVEPSLTVDLQASKDSVSLGDTVTYTFSATPEAGASNAYDTTVTFAIPEGMRYVAGSFSGQGTPDDTQPGELSVAMGTVVTLDGVKTFSFDTVVDNDATIDAPLTVTTTAGNYSSMPGTNPDERNYSFSASETLNTSNAAFIAANQVMELTFDANGNGVADPGDEVTITAVMTNTGPDANDVTFTHAIPANTTYVAGSATTSSGNLDDSAGVAVNQSVLPANDSISVSFTVVVEDTAANGALITAQGQVDSADTVAELTDADADDSNGDQPNILRIGNREGDFTTYATQQTFGLQNDADSDGNVSAGDTVRFSYTVVNDGTVDLTNIVISELIPAGLSYEPGSASISGANLIDVNGADITADIAQLAVGDAVTLIFDARIDEPMIDSDLDPNHETFVLQGTIESDQTEAAPLDANNIARDGAQALRFEAVSGVAGEPVIEMTETWVLTRDLDNDGQVDNGDEITFTVTATNTGAAQATGVTINQTYPANTRYIDDSASVSQGVLASEQPLTANMGTLAPGQSAQASYSVAVDGADSQFTLAFQSQVSGDNFVTVSSDDNASAQDGVNPVLVAVTDASSPALEVAAEVTATSDANTDGNTIVQGEVVTLQTVVTLPAGAIEQAELELQLPLDSVVQNATLTRVFDTGLSAAANPGVINGAGSNVAVPVSVSQAADRATLALGGIINSDDDANDEQYILVLELTTDNLVPTAEQTSLSVLPVLRYADNSGNAVEQAGNEVSLTLQNRVPEAADDAYSLDEDTPETTYTVLANDTDADAGQVLQISALDTTDLRGTVRLNDTATAIIYTPAADDNGTDTLRYTLTDNADGLSTTEVTFTIAPLPDAPVANSDVALTAEDTPVTIEVLNNDFDVDGEAFIITSASADSGVVSVVDDARLAFVPAQDMNGVATLTYVIEDVTGRTAQTTVAVTVSAANDAPQVAAISESMTEDSSLAVDVLSYASDIDGDTLVLTGLQSAAGSVAVNQAGLLVFTPDADYNGTAIVNFTVSDGNGGNTPGQLAVEVTPVNDAPVVTTSPVNTFIDVPVTIDVLDAAFDVDGDALQISQVSATNGTVSQASGQVTFTPSAGYEGPAQVNACVTDGVAEQCGLWTVSVVNPNTAPVLQDLTIEIGEDQSIALALNGFDADGDALTYRLIDEPQGQLAGNLPAVSYTPPADFDGADQFSYVANDGEFDSNIATVTVIIGAQNDKPEAIDDVVTTTDYLPLTIDVLANDSDPDGDELTIVGATAFIGEVSWSDSMLTYTPVEGFVGNAVLQYTIRDVSGQTASAKVLVTVDPEGSELLPVIEVPADVFIDAEALFTKVDLGVASAVDRFGNPLPVSLVDGVTFYEPGVNVAYWLAEDEDGRRRIASQFVRVRPLVSIDKDQTVLEGRGVTLEVHLNGTSPVYPLVVPYQVSGSASAADHNLVSGEVVITSGSSAVIRFDTFADELDDSDETIVITLGDTLNLGNKSEHVVTIAQNNVAPALTLKSVQDGEERVIVSRSGGLVTLSSDITHPDPDNVYEYIWQQAGNALTDLDDSEETFTVDPSSLTPGIYQLSLNITDADDTAFTDTNAIYLQVVERLPTLDEQDSDRDGVPDSVEGFRDSDGDGIPDYLDSIPECNVLPEEVQNVDGYLVEGDPGVCLRIGNTAISGQTGGAQVLEDDIPVLDDITPDLSAQNVGGIFDFIAYGLPRKGQTYNIVMPQRRPVPRNAVYRKYTQEQGWYTFVEVDENRLWSTQGEPGFCPPPGGSIWTEGLTPGHWCVQVSITDGGPYDDDGMANSTVVDPGGVGVLVSARSERQPSVLDAPIESSVEVLVDETIELSPLAEVTGAAEAGVTITSASANFGEVTFDGTTLLYTPPEGFVGEVIITYGLEDAQGNTGIGTLTVTIVANKPPVVASEQVTIDAGSRLNINVLDNDSDPDGDQIELVSATALYGTVFFSADGSLEYIPPTGFEGQDIVTYVVADAEFAESEGQVVITVEAVEVRIENTSGGAGGIMLLLALGGWLIRTAERWRQQYIGKKG